MGPSLKAVCKSLRSMMKCISHDKQNEVEFLQFFETGRSFGSTCSR